MKIELLNLAEFNIPLKSNQLRRGVLINLFDDKGANSWAEISPLPKWSLETLEDSILQLKEKQYEIFNINWTTDNFFTEISKLELLPSVTFGLESALLSLLNPLQNHTVKTSALLMGTYEEILEQAKIKKLQGFTSAKLKVSNLTFDEAFLVIHQLKDNFSLRIDVNRAWTTSESIAFFAQFPLNSFDYVEEPFQNPNDLAKFLHPLAIDESYPTDLGLSQLELLPTLKAIIYKPTIQGGILGCLALQDFAKKRGLELVLSSSFESDVGLSYIGSMAHRLLLDAPIGIGTYDYLSKTLCDNALQFRGPVVYIPGVVLPKRFTTKGDLFTAKDAKKDAKAREEA